MPTPAHPDARTPEAIRRDADNERLVRTRVQPHLARLGHYRGEVDGWGGAMTRDAWDAAFPDTAPLVGDSSAAAPGARWPGRAEAAIRAYYGPPGESQQVRIAPPYPMRIAWDPAVSLRSITCHRLVGGSLAGILEAIRDRHGLEWIKAHQLDHYGGCYNFRRMRGGSSWSTHAWGIAIDLDPARNGLRTPWPAKAAMPVEAIEAFEAEGWTSLARVIGRDAMHFQATSW